MYNNNFVAAIKSNGSILRERDDGVISIPFGSNYSILLKNLNTVDVVVNVEVDGESVLQGYNLVISPNTDFELLGKLKDLNKSNKFKFIHKTKQISDYRGDTVDDGLIRVVYNFVKPKLPIPEPYFVYNTFPTYSTRGGPCTGRINSNLSCSNFKSISDGITVKGEEFNCNFSKVSVDELEYVTYTIIFKLVGRTKNKKKIKKPLYVSTVLVCETCGQKSKSSTKYCSDCGTYLL